MSPSTTAALAQLNLLPESDRQAGAHGLITEMLDHIGDVLSRAEWAELVEDVQQSCQSRLECIEEEEEA